MKIERKMKVDATDQKILIELQSDSSQSLDEIARKVNSSKTPVWNRIRKMKEMGIVGPQVTLLDAEKLGFEACFFVLIRTSEHDAKWQVKFLDALNESLRFKKPIGWRETLITFSKFGSKMPEHTMIFISL